mgnify:CR=1 FL=1
MNPHYYSLNQYLREQFHEKVYKLALHGGETCPNRDGTCGEGGCIFCGEGSGSFASESIEEAIAKLRCKTTGEKYIAYFQSYTCTYRMSPGLIRRMFEAAEDDRVVALSLASRPDCMDGDAIDVIRGLRAVLLEQIAYIEAALDDPEHIEMEGYGTALIEALKKLNRDALSDLNPHPLIVKLEYSHPTLSQRIDAISGISLQ